MDRQLAIHRRGNLRIACLRPQPPRSTRRPHSCIPCYPVDPSIWRRTRYIRSEIPRWSFDKNPVIQQLCHHHDPLVNGHRDAVRKIAALPILCVSRLDHSVLAVASKSSPRFDICSLGGAGVGLERVSQYQC